MTLRRLTLGLAVATVAVAWLSAAGWSSMREDPPTAAPPAAEPEDTEPLGPERTRRLQERLAAAPRPAATSRNPFEFQDVRRESFRRAPRVPASASGDATIPALELPFTLIGIATHARPDGPARTAVLATSTGEIVLAAAGDVILDRYIIHAVGDDRVDVSDPDTGRRNELRLHAPAN